MPLAPSSPTTAQVGGCNQYRVNDQRSGVVIIAPSLK